MSAQFIKTVDSFEDGETAMSDDVLLEVGRFALLDHAVVIIQTETTVGAIKADGKAKEVRKIDPVGRGLR